MSADLLRVDIAGMSVMVRGEAERAHLEGVNRHMAVMKAALHRIARMNDVLQKQIAEEALNNAR